MTGYQDILYSKRPISRHPRMALTDRAKIFAPFAALRGFEISILTTEQDRVLAPRLTIAQERMEELDRLLRSLTPQDTVQVSWFEVVKTVGELELGEYHTETAAVLKVDAENRLLILTTCTLRVEDIVSLIGGKANGAYD